MTAKGREIVASLTAGAEAERAGIPVESRFTVRTVEMPEAPAAYGAAAVRAARHRLALSQAIFAQLFGGSRRFWSGPYSSN